MPAAARSIARPPATEPVKLMWSTAPDAISFVGLRRATGRGCWNRPFGSPAASIAVGEALADQQRLRGVLEDHRIAGHQRRARWC